MLNKIALATNYTDRGRARRGKEEGSEGDGYNFLRIQNFNMRWFQWS